jgi:hypothetical protein
MMSDAGSPAAAIAFFRSGSSNSTYRVELVVSGRIAATLPLPPAASAFSAAIAEKLFVNDVAEIDGVAVEALVLVDAGVLVALVVLLELDDELPHAATPMLAATASTATRALLFSKCICVSPPTSGMATTRRAAATTVETNYDTKAVCVNEPLISAAARKHAVNAVTDYSGTKR